MVATANISDEENYGHINVVVLSWDRNHEDALTDESRGGCSCITF
jgi:hypothetical protein